MSSVKLTKINGISQSNNEIIVPTTHKLVVPSGLKIQQLQSSGGTTIWSPDTYGNVTVGGGLHVTSTINCTNFSANKINLQVWTSSTRPTTNLSIGRIGYNSEIKDIEIYNGSAWKAFGETEPGSNPSNPLASPVAARTLGLAAGSYYFKSGSMSTAEILEYQPNYYENKPFCCVFRSPFGGAATTNKINLSIPMGGLLVQRDTLDLRGAVYWSSPITYTTVGGAGNNTADSGTGYAGSNARRVMLGNGGGHGIYNTGQQQCNWGDSTGSIGAGYNGSCGTFPDSLVWGTGQGSPFYANTSGTWSHWITWG